MYLIIEEKNTDWKKVEKIVKMHVETLSKVTHRAEHIGIRKGITWGPRQVIQVEDAKWQ